ncbi:MAG: molybdate ABC transporter substrate-binding protein [Spirulina sp.]
MDRKKVLRWLGVVGLGLGLGIACRPSPSELSTAPEVETTLLVGAAASLQGVMEAIQPGFETTHPAISLEYTFASSGQLQQQIEQGSPIDVFLSAGQSQMAALEAGGYVLAGSRQDLLGNALVLVVPAPSTVGIQSFEDLTQAEVAQIAVGDFGSVPAGQYTEQVLTNLGLIDDLRAKLVFFNTVREVLTAVSSNNVAAGVVYATDAASSDQVTVVATADPALHDPIIYPLAIINETAHGPAAQTFVDYLSSEAARTVFIDSGFTVLD